MTAEQSELVWHLNCWQSKKFGCESQERQLDLGLLSGGADKSVSSSRMAMTELKGFKKVAPPVRSLAHLIGGSQDRRGLPHQGTGRQVRARKPWRRGS